MRNNIARMSHKNYNLQQNIVDKFTKLRNIGFSREYFTADFLQFWSTTVKICLLGSRLVAFPSIPSISDIPLKFYDFLRSKVLSRLATRDTTSIFTFN